MTNTYPSGPLYIDDASGNIGAVNIQTGAVSFIGSSGVLLTDIAFTSNGQLYGTSFNGLYSINRNSGLATLLFSYGTVGLNGMNSLVGSGATLYAASSTTNLLYSINVTTLAITALNGTLAGTAAGDLAFSGGYLYETLSNGDLDRIALNGNNFSSTDIGSTGNSSILGLATGDNGITYAVSGKQVSTVNLSTAALTSVLTFSSSALGSANGTAYPGESGVTTVMNSDGSASITIATGGNTVTIASGSVATGLNGNTVIMGSGSVSVQSGGADVIFGGTGTDSVAATANAVVVGGAGALTFKGGPGDCQVFAGTGGLTYAGGTGSDVVVGSGNPLTVVGGLGGGTYFGGGNANITAGNGAQAVMVGSNGDKLYSAGASGDLFGVLGGGNVTMSGVSSTGNDVFFGGGGTGTLTFIAGSGNDIMGLGQGTNLVTLGSGHTTVFGNIGTTATTTINAGTGSADIGFGGKSMTLVIQSATARNFDLFNFVPGADKISISSYGSNAVSAAVASQTLANGITTLSLGDKSTIALIGVTHVDSSYFA